MNCHDYEEQLGDYVDGIADATTRAGVDAHLGACVRCSAIVADFEAIRAMSRELEPLTPPPRVWQALAARASRSPAPASGGWLGGWQPALAAAMAMLLATGLWWIGGRLSDGTGIADSGAMAAAQVFEAEEQNVEAQYTTAIAWLEEVTSTERTALDPDTAFVLDDGLTILDEAIGESRAALETQPDNVLVQASLFAALRRKIDVLQEMLALTNAMRRGNQDAAARILSEPNQ
jgi:hypothetical protein